MTVQIPPVVVARHQSCAAPRRLKDPFSPAAVREWAPTQWPEIGGPSLSLAPEQRFKSAPFKRLYQPGERVAVCVPGCLGLRVAVAQELRIGAWKISTSQIEAIGLEPRLNALGRDRYGSCHLQDGNIIEDPGFGEWVLSTLPDDLIVSPGAPLILHERGIEVILPKTLDATTFDRSLRQALHHAELSRWASSPEGRDHCGWFGLPPSRFQRYTRYGMCGSVRLSAAQEIYLFKPHLQGQRLVKVVESVILRHVLASGSSRHRLKSQSASKAMP